MKDTWKGIKQLITTRESKLSFPNKLEVNNSLVTDTKSIANIFNNYFATVGSDFIPFVNKSFKEFLCEPQCNSFYLSPTTPEEIMAEISNLNSNKTTGLYSIPTKMIKILKFLLSYPLNYLYNYSFSMGVVPDKLKIAKVIPIYKNGSHLMVSNYRPISLLSIFDKILEKLMCRRLIEYLDKYKILNENQFGFRHGYSTMQAILMITDKIQRAIEDKLFSCGLFLDLSKAFDTVNHEILISKLENYGIRGVAKKWFSSYLNNRMQFVSIGSCNSDYHLVTCGVPQGSVLGPLLFLLYINDFNRCSSILDFHLFADDSNLFLSDTNLMTLELKMNEELANIHIWLCSNKLSLNIDKTNFVIFHPRQKKIIHNVKLSINNKLIKQAKSIKYLGVLMDCHLNWKDHVLHVSKKIARSIGALSKLRHFVNCQVLTQLYYAIVYPFLTYSCVIWGSTYKTNIKPLEILQKKSIRIMTFSKFDAHTSRLFAQLQLLKLCDIIIFYTAYFMYQYTRGTLPKVFDTFFSATSSMHSYSTRHASRSTFSLPKVRTNYGKFNIRFYGAKVWNDIAEPIKALNSYQFKRELKAQFLSSY